MRLDDADARRTGSCSSAGSRRSRSGPRAVGEDRSGRRRRRRTRARRPFRQAGRRDRRRDRMLVVAEQERAVAVEDDEQLLLGGWQCGGAAIWPASSVMWLRPVRFAPACLPSDATCRGGSRARHDRLDVVDVHDRAGRATGPGRLGGPSSASRSNGDLPSPVSNHERADQVMPMRGRRAPELRSRETPKASTSSPSSPRAACAPRRPRGGRCSRPRAPRAPCRPGRRAPSRQHVERLLVVGVHVLRRREEPGLHLDAAHADVDAAEARPDERPVRAQVTDLDRARLDVCEVDDRGSGHHRNISRSAGMTSSCAVPSPPTWSPRTTAAGCLRSSRGRARRRRRSRRRRRRPSRAARSRSRRDGRASPRGPQTRDADRHVHDPDPPGASERSLTTTPTSCRVRSRSESGGSPRRTRPGRAGAARACRARARSTRRPRPRRTRIRAGSRRSRAAAASGRRAPPRGVSPRAASGRGRPRALARARTPRRRRAERLAPPPSTRPSARRRRRRRSRARPARRSARRGRRPRRSRACPRREDPELRHGENGAGERLAPPRRQSSASSPRPGARPGARHRGAVGVRLVEDERVDRPRIARRRRRPGSVPPARRSSIRPAGPLIARPPTSGLTATDGDSPPLDRGADLLDGEDRPDADERVARAETISSACSIASITPGAGRADVLSLEADAVDVVAMPPPDEPLLERERAVRGVDPGAEAVVGRGQQRRLEPERGASRAVTDESGAPPRERLRAHEVKPEITVAEHEPALAAEPLHLLERGPRLVRAPQPRSSSATPPSA